VTTTVDRPVPPLGGFSPKLVALESRRVLRNRRTLIFTVVVPTVFFLIFGLNGAYANFRYGSGNVSAEVLISMALYGAVLATTSGGATVSLERAAGWTRTLRVTPLTSVAYVAVKMVTSLVLGALAVAVVYVVGAFTGEPRMPLWVWLVAAIATWLGSLVFSAFGLFIGYLLPSENVMQLIGFALMLFSFGGGLFVPLSQFSPALRTMAELTPLWGLSQLVHYPLGGGAFRVTWVANVAVWLAVFSLGAAWRFARATERT
jgi:ABC-2 type transport system permease protein